MGNCCESQAEVEARKWSRQIDMSLNRDNSRLRQLIRVLLIGSKESDKDLIWMQMKGLHLEAITEAERVGFREKIQSSILRYVRGVVLLCEDLNIELNTSNCSIAEEFKSNSSVSNGSSLTRDMAEKITRLWADIGIKEAHRRYEERYRSQISKRNAEHFLNSIDRFVGDDFEVTDDDILKLDFITPINGVRELEFAIENCSYVMTDVSGQHGDIKKWLPCFEGVTAVIFCAPLDEYDMCLPEHRCIHLMEETLKNYDMLVTSKWFPKSTAFILLLTRKDIFEEKINKGIPLQHCFPDYCGKTFDQACGYIKSRFTYRYDRNIHCHITTGDNTENIRIIFNAIKDVLLSSSYEDAFGPPRPTTEDKVNDEEV